QFDVVQPMDTVFSIYAPAAVSTTQPQMLELDRTRLTMRLAPDRPNAGQVTNYRVQSAPDPDDDLLAALSTRDGFHYTPTLPIRDRDVEELGRRLLRSADLPFVPPGDPGSPERYRWNQDAARRFMNYLQSGEYFYTTDLTGVVIPAATTQAGDTDFRDPISYFLLDLKRGHCEYFASGLAFMCLHMGIPARVVTGFVAYDYDENNQQYNVVEANAHAWV